MLTNNPILSSTPKSRSPENEERLSELRKLSGIRPLKAIERMELGYLKKHKENTPRDWSNTIRYVRSMLEAYHDSGEPLTDRLWHWERALSE